MGPEEHVFFYIILLHGLAHGGAFIGQIYNAKGYNSGGWKTARSWLSPSMRDQTAMIIASVFWIASMVGYVFSALAFREVFITNDIWDWLVIISTIVSTIGILIFLGNWPIFNTSAALGVNVLIVTQVYFSWPLDLP